MNKNDCNKKEPNLRVINVGLNHFYEALVNQKIKVVQIEWHPPVKQSEEINKLLDKYL